ncbi:MAG: ferredoxin [Pseudomonadota bacterium]
MSGGGYYANPDSAYSRLNGLLQRCGLMARGGVHLDSENDRSAREHGYSTIVLAGHAGSSLWPEFERFRRKYHQADPLDAWSKSVGGSIEAELGCVALYPFEKPWWPFQNWISRSEGLKPSPLAILIHPEYGLWHGYRAAFAFREAISIPPPKILVHACDSCPDRPCMSACPASAITEQPFAIDKCRGHLASAAGRLGCMVRGCLSRNACPVGAQYRYNDTQLRFHMDALNLPVS